MYRWKRKSLVPEEWFIRKSAFTGQETYFPKQRMLARIDKIKNMKDDLSLDELADMFSPMPTDVRINKNELVKRNIVTKIAADYAEQYLGQSESYTFEQALYVFMLDHCLQTGEMNLDEGKFLLKTFTEHYKKFDGKNCDLIFSRKMGVSAFMLLSAGSDIYFEPAVKMILRVSVAKSIEELKLKITTM
ncbi:YhbD family protein [Cohnella kolymensis]|uniref:YhbD family protein n=1 Tax=Cohnella kolymensis TaxID=1590652 RepID=UPI002E14D03C